MAAQSSAPFAGLVSGKFNTLPGREGILYARQIESNGAMLDLWVKLSGKRNGLILMAPQGRFEWIDERLALVLENGKSYQGLDTHEAKLSVQDFERFEGYLPQLQSAMAQQDKGVSQTTAALLSSPLLEDQVLLHWRVLIPFSVIVLGLLGLKLSKTQPRQGRFAKLFIAIVLFVVYNQLLTLTKRAVLNGVVPIEVAFWPIPVLFILYALWPLHITGAKKRPFKRGLTSV